MTTSSQTAVPNLSVLGQDNSQLFHTAETNENITPQQKQLPPHLANHPAFSEVFQADKLTLGLIAPFKGYPNSPIPSLEDFGETAVLAEQLGFYGCEMCPFMTQVLAMLDKHLTPWLPWAI